MKIVKIFLIVSFFFAGLALLQGSRLVQQTCAAGWGSACSNSQGVTYHICPRTGAAYGGCQQSVDFNITIQTDGTAIPAGQQFNVQIFPSGFTGADAPGANDCPGVTCLNRAINYPTSGAGWQGTSYTLPALDQIGCDTTASNCTNDYKVRVRFADTIIAGGPNCPNDINPDLPVRIQNGVSQNLVYTIHCQTPLVSTPTATPTACPVLAAPVPVVTCNECTN